VQLNPNSIPESVRLGWTLLYAKRLDEAAEQGRKILELDTASGRWILGLTYEQKGDLQRAIGEFREALQLSVRDEQKSGWSAGFAHWTLAALAHACAISGRKAEALGLLERLKTLTRRPGVDAANFAVIYTGLGDKDQAFQWLDRGYNDRPSTMERVGVEPRLEPLHADPRFTEFLRKMGLPE
jgi:tetratricopeptide (TPR) repeat protein